MAQATTHVNVGENAVSDVGLRIFRICFRVSLVMSIGVIALIGIWSVAALIGGTLSAGGPLEMVGSWFSAISG